MNSPSARAGVQKGDRIVAIAGEPIVDRNAYFAIVRTLQPGETVSLTLERGGVLRQVQVQAATDAKKPPV